MPLPQRAYVWQRVWTPALGRSVRAHARAYAALDVFAAEVSFNSGSPVVSRASPDWPVLVECARPVSVVVRIGPTRTDWAANAPETRAVVAVCRRVLAEARAHGVEPAELQIDFDAATSRLAAYQAMLRQVRQEVAPPRLVITTLPSWVGRPEFLPLVTLADGYVLQVHSLAKPASAGAPFTLCDPAQARHWITEAERLGRPFRLALPSYAYRVAFSASGQFLGLQAEGAARTWPSGAIVRRVAADPVALAALVRDVQARADGDARGVARERREAAACEALCWFRFPSDRDDLAWRWVTLEKVMTGAAPVPRLVAHTTPLDGAAVEGAAPPVATSGFAMDVIATNEGDADGELGEVAISWSGSHLLAADAIAGWQLQRATAGHLVLRPSAGSTLSSLAPGASVAIGWLRLDAPAAVVVTAQ